MDVTKTVEYIVTLNEETIGTFKTEQKAIVFLKKKIADERKLSTTREWDPIANEIVEEPNYKIKEAVVTTKVTTSMKTTDIIFYDKETKQLVKPV